MLVSNPEFRRKLLNKIKLCWMDDLNGRYLSRHMASGCTSAAIYSASHNLRPSEKRH